MKILPHFAAGKVLYKLSKNLKLRIRRHYLTSFLKNLVSVCGSQTKIPRLHLMLFIRPSDIIPASVAFM